AARARLAMRVAEGLAGLPATVSLRPPPPRWAGAAVFRAATAMRIIRTFFGQHKSRTEFLFFVYGAAVNFGRSPC
ncbi:hypothetical protein, partial [Streptomyces sp. NPDC002463]|uniref:hypothetical protein n=1 Tax=Streptomyces sp. NPDC002463 TaxID=3364645 RepID=UPI00368BA58C